MKQTTYLAPSRDRTFKQTEMTLMKIVLVTKPDGVLRLGLLPSGPLSPGNCTSREQELGFRDVDCKGQGCVM
jgi:hypothetical protein